ncbi:hypothetical protein [Streptomyces sp. NRRL F-5135]|uniref:hypothetical protein n=1 Tax=Streptomyces sp. NRRL F-5135 TaxID=1463858 RepID=UPI00068AF557|nr:hypothetical protein [Streptomyces sp. NRRL F-5135]
MPLRLVVGEQYSDAALPVYVKIAALAMRPQGCRAKVATIAGYLGMSKSAVERGLKDLRNPDPVDGVTEVLTVRRTTRDGDGESAERRVRAMDTDGPELYVWIPVRAAEALTPRQLRLYAAIAYAQARRIPLALADLRDLVRHQSGEHAGEPLGERQVMRIVDDLEASGWVSVHRRQGPRGRHIYEAHTRPLHMIGTGQTAQGPGAVSPDIHDGSAPRSTDGSPCVEDPRTDRPDENDTELSGEIRRRRGTGSKDAGPVENPGPVPATFRRRGPGHGEKRSSGGGYTGPGLQLSARAWAVLAPVRHELEAVSVWELRRIGQEIGRQLSGGVGQERLTARLTARYASTQPPRRGIGRWILGTGLVRHGCGLAACESGTLWHTGQPCQVCLDNTLHRQQQAAAQQPGAARAQHPTPAPAPAAQRQHEPPGLDHAARPPTIPMPPAVPGPRAPHEDLTPQEMAALRAAATTEAIRDAITVHGQARAAYLYGHALVMPVLATLDPDHGPVGGARAQ